MKLIKNIILTKKEFNQVINKKLKFLRIGFCKKLLLLLCLLAIVSLIFAKKTPLEAKFLIDHLKSEEKTNDIVTNPDKYQKMSCFDLKFNGIEYCFDRSKSYFDKRYISNKGEDETVVLRFIPKVLSEFPQDNKSIRVYWHVDAYLSNPMRSIRNNIKDLKVYDNLLNNSENEEFIEVTSLLKFEKNDPREKYKYFAIVANKRIILNAEMHPFNEYYKFIADISYQRLDQTTYFEFHIVSNQKTQKEFLQTVLDIAQEFEQYLESSEK